ncbi:alpha-1,2-mannosyltransferase [Ephemerocybe angulata]|uniref:Alpha-1,2-mannosyltransferase n=1 Tax=Ephemerocybe angulata TaxID=980116 RepID=A0A8H6H7Q0_9AGAR|nr:alpha-1,2-mannosyltransferase [Tulosesus angulatus]
MSPTRNFIVRLAALAGVLLLAFRYLVSPSVPHRCPGSTSSLQALVHNPPHHDSIITTPRLTPKANATFLIFAYNADLERTIRTVRSLEDRFNMHHGYPYVLFSPEPFTPEFKRRLRVLTPSPIEFGLIPQDEWTQPEGIDEARAQAVRKRMVKEQIMYGGSVEWRNKARYMSGKVWAHEMLAKYKWAWRVEPGVGLTCDVLVDPFVWLKESGKVVGFTLATKEDEKTADSLWVYTKDFMTHYPQHLAIDNSLAFISDRRGQEYNLCSYLSGFLVTDMDFFRSSSYSAFYNYLNKKGGFYYERWSDASVLSLAASVLLKRKQAHLLEDIGFQYGAYSRCPKRADVWENGRCACGQSTRFNDGSESCEKIWKDFMSLADRFGPPPPARAEGQGILKGF